MSTTRVTKPDLVEVDFEVVPDSLKTTLTSYDEAPIVKVLLEGKAVRVPYETSLARMYKYAKIKNMIFHKRKTDDGMIVWLETKNE